MKIRKLLALTPNQPTFHERQSSFEGTPQQIENPGAKYRFGLREKQGWCRVERFGNKKVAEAEAMCERRRRKCSVFGGCN